VGRTAPVLALFAALFAAIFAYDFAAPHLWRLSGWWAVAWIAVVLLPAVFLLALLGLPWREAPWLPLAVVAFVVLTIVFTAVGSQVVANACRLVACTLLAWWFLQFFETLGWVVLVACIIPWVDAYSVWRGPTKSITEHHPGIFNKLMSYAFPVPGSHSPARLGVPDLLFFALFLAAADRFRLRVLATWACSVALLGATIALTVWWGVDGLPALPAIALGLLVPNADLIWRRLRT
jgi:hypothetical protein